MKTGERGREGRTWLVIQRNELASGVEVGDMEDGGGGGGRIGGEGGGRRGIWRDEEGRREESWGRGWGRVMGRDKVPSGRVLEVVALVEAVWREEAVEADTRPRHSASLQ